MVETEKATFKRKNGSQGSIKRNRVVSKSIQNANSKAKKGDIGKPNETFDETMSVEYNKDDMIKDITFLQSCKVNDANMPTIYAKLRSTVGERLKMINDDKTNLLEKFPYFFCEPKLVCQYMFSNFQSSSNMKNANS